MTKFFVPGADAAVPDAGEAAYRRLAELVGAVPAEPGRRIRLVAYRVGRESWTAEVGRKLSGTRPEHRRRKGEFTTTTEKLTGHATVLAIFAGPSFTIVTDEEPATDSSPTAVASASTSASASPTAVASASAPATVVASASTASAGDASASTNPIRVDKPSRIVYFAG